MPEVLDWIFFEQKIVREYSHEQLVCSVCSSIYELQHDSGSVSFPEDSSELEVMDSLVVFGNVSSLDVQYQ